MTKTLNASVRQKVGKVNSRQLRKNGLIPAVVYGSGQPIHITLSEHEFNREFKKISETTLIDLNIDGKVKKVLIKDFQDNLYLNKILHLDFMLVDEAKTIRTHVPIHVIGTARGQKEGGILELITHSLEVDCLPKDLPEAINVDVSNLNLGDTIHLRDLPPIAGVHFHGNPDLAIVHVTTPKEHNLTPQTQEEATEPTTTTPAKS